jgi:quercetin dioxygenase-like cupin family protein
MKKKCLMVVGALVFLPTSVAAQQARGWPIDLIPWQEDAADGSRFAQLEGSRDTPGEAFSYAFSIPAGGFDGPHAHSTTARVFVARGALKLGYGTIPDPAQMVTYPQGSYVVVPAGMVHYDGAEVDTIIIGTATGPWATTYVDPTAEASAGTPPEDTTASLDY